MCFNCGCGLPNDDMGKGRVTQGGASLTLEDLKVMSDKWGMSLEDTEHNIHDLLEKTMKPEQK